ncbi:phage resistance protein [Streptomyces sp. NPDC014656]|uniref:BREX-2 system ATPase PglY n=1 Tax=Streptomyces sp. NPDC014656 TaxID=3364878 RepID=UPI0036FA146E
MAPTAATAPLLRDVIDIKTSISTSDFVLKLAEAVTEEGTERALRDYVVTERLLENFDEALGLIKAALDGQTSKAAYLHGSFGSGKSHFMAVLHALLRGAPAARARADFDPVLAKHEWLGTERKRFLLVPYHMLGAKSLEQRVLGGYVSHVRALHPDAPIPQVYRTDALFEDIRSHRLRMGDDAFINGLSGVETEVDSVASDDEDEWGDSFAWTSALLDAALSAEELDGGEVNLNLVNPTTPAELRAKLVHDASATWFPGFAKNAAEDEHGFISLDAGLAVIAEHAKSLGYDGLILFMDELILWLANRIHDQKFVSREADKITNFVEGADSRRAIPIVSFIARQRDLRELVGEETSGAAETAIQDSLNLASGRFDKITLEDRNLPQIAHARLLRPKDAEAAAKLDAAFAKIKRVGPQVWDVLLGSEEGTTGADEDSFRLTYPFSPAFMDTLVHISSALQRSRTGLKLMGQLLADHRDDATLEQLIPLGDLYPVIADGGDKPFVDSLKVEFQAADKLYRSKLRPHLLATYEVTEEDIERYRHRPGTITDPQLLSRCKGFTGDNRLMCTLLLSALAPSVPALRDLTIRRLGALNHGSVVSPIPGAEVGVIKSKVDEWAANFAEIKPTGTSANPGVRLELAGVDVDSVIANAKANNNRNNRLALARRLLEEELGVERQEQLSDADELRFIWRGSNRTMEVVFGHIADTDQLPDHDLAPSQEGLWRLVVDLPYDEGEFGPRDDANRMGKLRERPGVPSRTVAWIPTHISAARYKDFERLVTIDYALADPRRFDTMYAQHLNADNRARAKGLLEGQRDSLIKSVKAAFKQAYGLAAKAPADVNVSFNDHFESLREVPDLRVSIGQSLSDAARHIASKLLAQQFPAHPDLDPDGTKTAVRPADARTVFGYIRAAVEAGDRQAEIPAKDRTAMRRIAAPLGLGQQKEAYFRLSNRWVEHFALQARTDGGPGDLSVVQLTDWIDRPEPMGLEPFLANLVIASFAEMDDRVWVRSGALLDPAPELPAIKPIDALRSQPLPDESVWEEAGRRYWDMFGEKPPTLRRGRIVGQFARQILGKAREYQQPADSLVTELEKHAILLGLDSSDEAGRLALARRSRDLLDELKDLDRGAASGAAAAKQVITAFATFDLGEVSASRYGASIKQAQSVASALATTVWDMLKLAPTYGPEGEAVLERLRRAAQADQRTENLKDELERAGKSIIDVIRRSQAAAAPAPQPPVSVAPEPVGPTTPNEVDLSTETSRPPVPTSHPTPGRAKRRSGSGRAKASQALAELRAELAELMEAEPDATVEISWRVVE